MEESDHLRNWEQLERDLSRVNQQWITEELHKHNAILYVQQWQIVGLAVICLSLGILVGRLYMIEKGKNNAKPQG